MTRLQGPKTLFGHVMKTLLVDELSTCLSQEPMGEEELDGHFLVGTTLFRRSIPVHRFLQSVKHWRRQDWHWLMRTKVKELGAIGQQQVSLCWLTADFQPIHCSVAVIIILAFICLNSWGYWEFQENPHVMKIVWWSDCERTYAFVLVIPISLLPFFLRILT